MALALGATAGILYLRFESSLNHSIDQTLSARAKALRLVIASAPERQWPDLLRDQTEVGQVLDRHGRILASTRAARREALLGPQRSARADRRKVLATVGRRPGLGHATRVLGVSVPRHEAVLAVGTPLRARADANESFSRAILLAAPVALAFAAALGYALAAGALRPVEVMRRRAAAISPLEPGTRLPQPHARTAAAGPRRRRRDPPPRRDPQRDARAAREGGRERAALCRRREPRAAHADRHPALRARPRPAT